MGQKRIFVILLLLTFLTPLVFSGNFQSTSPQQAVQDSDELAKCEQNLSILRQQLREPNQTLENVTRERDYYKTRYENMTVNVTNLELIEIKQNITILNQQIQQ